MNQILIVGLVAVGLSGCASTIAPSFTFSYTNRSLGDPACAPTDFSGSLSPHPTSAIQVKEGTPVRLSIRSAYFAELQKSEPTRGSVYAAELPEIRAPRKDYIGNREVLLYAKIYKNGQFLKYSKITDIAEHMAAYKPVVVQKPVFFTETVDGYYQIVIKGYEVDAKAVVKALRRVRNIDIESLEQAGYSPGDVFTSGIKDVVFGIFDMVLAITGRTVDDWAAKIGADKVLEHSIYVTPGGADENPYPREIIVLGSGDNEYFVQRGANNDREINDKVEKSLKTLQGEKICDAQLMNGKNSTLSGSAYVWIRAEGLVPATASR